MVMIGRGENLGRREKTKKDAAATNGTLAKWGCIVEYITRNNG